jgi:hypothetical protein
MARLLDPYRTPDLCPVDLCPNLRLGSYALVETVEQNWAIESGGVAGFIQMAVRPPSTASFAP